MTQIKMWYRIDTELLAAVKAAAMLAHETIEQFIARIFREHREVRQVMERTTKD